MLRGLKGSRDFRLLKLFLLMTRFTSKCRVQELVYMSVTEPKNRSDGNQEDGVAQRTGQGFGSVHSGFDLVSGFFFFFFKLCCDEITVSLLLTPLG